MQMLFNVNASNAVQRGPAPASSLAFFSGHANIQVAAAVQNSMSLQDNENNDDQCCICQSDGQMLVECDHCPRSFHQNCHLPFVDDGTVR
uniref:PHD-type domain-containing protein n=1 Tax=Gouania willdenowi TaxID=441366 RepID=A0A8C5DSE9_GOUWI